MPAVPINPSIKVLPSSSCWRNNLPQGTQHNPFPLRRLAWGPELRLDHLRLKWGPSAKAPPKQNKSGLPRPRTCSTFWILTGKTTRLFVTGAENKPPREKMLYRCYQAVEVIKNNDYGWSDTESEEGKEILHRIERILVAADKAKTEGATSSQWQRINSAK